MKVQTSWQAKMEARMPFMSVYLPDSFLTLSDYAKNLVSNEDKLTTPYDIYMTLKDIIDV